MYIKVMFFYVDAKWEKKHLKKSQNVFNLFKEHLFLHIISKIQDDTPVNTCFIKL